MKYRYERLIMSRRKEDVYFLFLDLFYFANENLKKS